MAESSNFHAVFERLKSILQKYESRLILTIDEPGHYSLNTPYSAKYKKELFFGAVQIQKNYVSYYLMPMYMYPGSLEGITSGLKKRMQGKSCFNFKSVDEEIFSELEELTKNGMEMIRKIIIEIG